MEIYTIELSEDQWNIVMEGLGELPLKRSLPVFEEINNQYIAQKKAPKTEGKEAK